MWYVYFGVEMLYFVWTVRRYRDHASGQRPMVAGEWHAGMRVNACGCGEDDPRHLVLTFGSLPRPKKPLVETLATVIFQTAWTYSWPVTLPLELWHNHRVRNPKSGPVEQWTEDMLPWKDRT